MPVVMVAGAAALLLWTRLPGIDQSFWNDEVFSIVNYTSHGPKQILTAYTTNDHVLFNLLAWATTRAIGHSEAAFRLWSVVPAIAAAVLVTGWMWRRLGPCTAAVLAVLIATSPVHQDLAREARGYGLTFLAGASMLVFADRVANGGSRRDLAGFAAAGTVGGFTIPVFALAFVGQALPLLFRRDLRRRVLVAIVGVGVALVVLYAASLTGILNSAGQHFGRKLPWHAPLSAIMRDLLGPSSDVVVGRSTDAYAVLPYRPDQLLLGVLAMVGFVLAWRSRQRMLAFLLATPLVFVYSVLTVAQVYVETRFASFLLFHALALTAIGAVSAVELLPARGLRIAAIAAGAVAAVFATAHMLQRSAVIRAIPRENFKAVARIVAARGDTRILTDSTRPVGFQYYLGADNVVLLPPAALQASLCSSHPPNVYVDQPFLQPRPPDVSCLARDGAQRITVRQRDRGGRLDVWLLPRAHSANGR